MSAKTVKIAISLPKEIMSQIEVLRNKLGLARSQAVVEAIRLWLKKMEEEALDRKYVQGYRRKPEDPAELNPLIMAGLSSFSKEKW